MPHREFPYDDENRRASFVYDPKYDFDEVVFEPESDKDDIEIYKNERGVFEYTIKNGTWGVHMEMKPDSRVFYAFE